MKVSATVTKSVGNRGWAHVADYCDLQTLADLKASALDLADRPGAQPSCLYYLDGLPDGQTRLARLERVADVLPLRTLMPRMQADAEACLGASVQLFKDKLNIRYPKSAGYAPHQDAARWEAFGKRFLSIGIFLEDSGPDNGGFEFADGDVARVGDDLDTAAFDALPRTPVNAKAGDALFIEGMSPHRTLSNGGDTRILHLLFTFATGGSQNAREAYYAAQKAQFAHVALGNMFRFPARG